MREFHALMRHFHAFAAQETLISTVFRIGMAHAI
jgi:hypothetical protein